jgi:hypothetical protein
MVDLFFDLLRFAFGLHASFPASLLGKRNVGGPVKGAFAGRSNPKSTVLNSNQPLI